ncbi:ParB/RepB/Spo0J family partition protein (plasmid) [Streptomyces sp. NBC_00723]|uniref:ParB/RepB/Spo0J family partition protein n=1 Tax=Streptomyces sp. NBC_00723 TaxID=2903673 RepID=UPI002F919E8E
MSKADQLGSGRFGGSVRNVSARRQAVAAATGVPTDGVAPPTELPVHRISPNPDNPRSSLGDLTDLAGSLKTHGQKQAITVMNRDAYIKANPDRAADLEQDITHVVIDGSSRLAAAREAGLASLKVMVSDEQGGTSEELLESALVANIHRQDLEELDEARALQRLLAIHGSQRALATRLHRSQGWVSQRVALLNLTPELQSRIGQEPIDLLRAVGNRPADQQEAALAELKAERARKEQQIRAAVSQPVRKEAAEAAEADEKAEGAPDGDEGDYGVINDRPADNSPAAPAAPAAPAEAEQRDDEPASEPEPDQGVPEPRNAQADPAKKAVDKEGSQPRSLPYDDPWFIAMHLKRKMEEPAFFELLRQLAEVGQERDPAKFAEVMAQFTVEPAS